MWSIRKGATRRVVLTEHYAIKIARTGLMAFLVLPYRLFFKKGTNEKVQKYTKGRGFLRGSFDYIVYTVSRGYKANKHEAFVSKTVDGPFAPVLATYLFTFILVMKRGVPTHEAESESLRAQYTAHDLCNRPDHVLRFGDTLLFVDYGHPDDMVDFDSERPAR